MIFWLKENKISNGSHEMETTNYVDDKKECWRMSFFFRLIKFILSGFNFSHAQKLDKNFYRKHTNDSCWLQKAAIASFYANCIRFAILTMPTNWNASFEEAQRSKKKIQSMQRTQWVQLLIDHRKLKCYHSLQERIALAEEMPKRFRGSFNSHSRRKKSLIFSQLYS